MPPTLIDINQINGTQLETFILNVISGTSGQLNSYFGSDDIPLNADTISVTFSTPFATVPKVIGSVSNTANTNIVGFQILNIATTGFDVVFSSQTPDANYVFSYLATTAEGPASIITSP